MEQPISIVIHKPLTESANNVEKSMINQPDTSNISINSVPCIPTGKTLNLNVEVEINPPFFT